MPAISSLFSRKGKKGKKAPPVVDSWSIAMEKLGIPWTNPYFST
jgi:hypothetical protein